MYDIILHFHQEAHVETMPIPPALTSATQQHHATKPIARNKSIASSSRKKRCGQCVGCRTPDCGKCRFCADKKRNGGMGRLKKGCIHRQCTGGQPISTTSTQSSFCMTKATTVNISDVEVPSRQPINSQAVSAALSQAILLQLQSVQLNRTGVQLTQGKWL